MTVTILHGDCTTILPTLAAGTFHTCVTSPPNAGRFRNGEHRSPITEFKRGQHWRPHGPHRDREWLEREYVTLQRSSGDIAKGIGLTESAIIFWLREHGIQRRTVAEARAIKHWGVSGAANPMHGKRGAECPSYIDGGTPERQRQYSCAEGIQFLANVFKRDKWTCQRCGEKRGGKYSLRAHHIRSWARNPELRFISENVTSLCRPCHLWVHSKKNVEREFIT